MDRAEAESRRRDAELWKRIAETNVETRMLIAETNKVVIQAAHVVSELADRVNGKSKRSGNV